MEKILNDFLLKAKAYGSALSGQNVRDFDCIKIYEDGEMAVVFSGYNRGAWEDSEGFTLLDLEGTIEEVTERGKIRHEERLEAERNRIKSAADKLEKEREAKEKLEYERLQKKYGTKKD